MSSQARIEANRANSKHSTGPVTPQGKAKASRNALKHGLLSREVVLATEDRAEFEGFRERMSADLGPVGELEETLADRVAGQWWRLKRVARVEAGLFEHDERAAETRGQEPFPSGEKVPDPSVRDPLAEALGKQFCPYDTLRRYERAIERGLESAMRQFREAQKLRGLRKPDEPEEEPICDKSLYYFYEYLLYRENRATRELREAHEAAKAAGFQLPKSTIIEEMDGRADVSRRWREEHGEEVLTPEEAKRRAEVEAMMEADEKEPPPDITLEELADISRRHGFTRSREDARRELEDAARGELRVPGEQWRPEEFGRGKRE
jgi:hypothetical protein